MQENQQPVVLQDHARASVILQYCSKVAAPMLAMLLAEQCIKQHQLYPRAGEG